MNQNKQDKKHFKYFFLSDLSLKNKTSVFLITFLVIIGGLGSYLSMPKELYPEVKIPTIFVQTPYPGNSPIDIENLISRPIEKQIKPIKGIKTLNSTSIQDNSVIFVEFNPDVDVDEALMDVKDAVDKAKSDLPSDLEFEPSVSELDMTEFPILNINMAGDYSVDDLKEWAEDLQDDIENLNEITRVDIKGTLEREINVQVDLPGLQQNSLSLQDIENLSEITRVDIKGTLEREINVLVDLPRLQQNSLSLLDIETAIASENVSISGGDILINDNRRNVRVVGEFKKASDMEDIIVKYEGGDIVYLRDIAKIIDGYEERKSYARLDRQPVVSLDVIKKSGANLLDATDKILLLIEKAKKNKLPNDLKITITNDQSEMTRAQILNLENSIIMGVILVVLVLLFFLGLRNALFVGLAIPMSMLLSFLVMSFMGMTMNLMVLFSLILALGMLVDNAIVAIENIYRLYDKEGYSPWEAARAGVGEIAVPIISSTATTLAAFFPLLLWNDMIGEFMKYIPITLITVLSSSLFVALVINPVVTATWIEKEDYNKRPDAKKILLTAVILIVVGLLLRVGGMRALGGVLICFAFLGFLYNYVLKQAARWFQEVLLVKLENGYKNFLRKALSGNRPAIFLTGTFGVLILSLVILVVSDTKVEFFPVNEPKYINVFVEMPIGADIESTNVQTERIEASLFGILEPYTAAITSVVSSVGQNTGDPNQGPSMGDTPNKSRITISFAEFQDRENVSSLEAMKAISRRLEKVPGVKVAVEKNAEGPAVGKAITIDITGEDLDELILLADNMKHKINQSGIEGIESLGLDIELGKPELLVDIDRVKARQLGLSTGQIGSAIRTALFGKEVSKFKDGEDEYKIQLRLQDKYRYDVSSLMNQMITFRDQATGKIVQVPVSAVADIKYSSTYGSVNRKDLERKISIGSNVLEGYNATEVNGKIRELLIDYELPEGYSFKFAGQQEQQSDSTSFLMNALLIAIALIWLILVSQFNSLSKPIIIVVTILFSTIGVFLGTVLFNMDIIIIMTGIGIVSLAGIVVNNSIVLIDYANLLKSRVKIDKGIAENEDLSWEENKEVVIETGAVRLRPVLLTAITTVLGLIPLATGMNVDFTGLFSSLEPDFYWGGDNAIWWGPMAWTVIFGLSFATFLTLIILPVMYFLTDRAKVRFRKYSRK